jgi:outer membrane protein, heavy metal efflux system
MYRFIIVIAVTASWLGAFAQQTMSEAEVVDRALKNSGTLQAAELKMKQSKYREKTAFNLPNPDVIAESPTGTFYAVGVLQSLEFPSVYFRQHRVNKELTELSKHDKEISRQQLISYIRSLYLNLQVTEAEYNQLRVQDSLYAKMSQSADRQFEAGTIDYLAKKFTETQAAEIHNQLIEKQGDYETLLNQLKTFTGFNGPIKPAALTVLETHVGVFDSAMIESNPSIKYYEQLQQVNKQSLSLERNKALPGIVVGYLNQGERNTETNYRFRVGVTVPLWFWQYSGNIKSAKTAVAVAASEAKAQEQALTADLHQAIGNVKKFRQSLEYYQLQGIDQADEIIDTARRLFESGQTDYIAFLRNVNDAYAIKTRYLETLKNYNQSVITLNYLTGKL